MASRRAAAFTLATALLGGAACGTRTSVLYDYAPLDAAIDAADAADAADTADVLDAADTFEAEVTPTPCKWGVGTTTQLTFGPDDHELTSAIHVAGGALVGSMSSDDPATDRAWTVTPVAADGTLAGSAVALFGDRPNGLTVGGLSLTDGYGRRGALVWDSKHSCRFTELDPSTSAAIGTVQPSKTEFCSGLHAAPEGFRWVEGDLSPGYTHDLASFDFKSLFVNANGIAPLSDKAYWLAVVGAPDGATLAAWIADGRSPARIVASESPISGGTSPTYVEGPAIEGTGRWIRLAPTEASENAAHVIWTDGPTGTPTANVRFTTLDRTTHTFDAAHLVTAQAFRDAGVGLGAANGDVLVAWMEGDATHAQRLYVQPLNKDGTPRAERLLVRDFFVGSSPRLVATSQGALVVYMAEPTAQPMQVFATALVCPP